MLQPVILTDHLHPPVEFATAAGHRYEPPSPNPTTHAYDTQPGNRVGAQSCGRSVA